MAVLISHLESRLGQIQSGWTKDPRGQALPFQLTAFTGSGQLPGSTSFATLGLSDHRLAGKDKPVSLELMMITHSAQAPARLPQALLTVAMALFDRHEAILRGETFVLPGTVADGSTLSAVCATLPGYFDSDFDAVTIEDGTQVAIVLLLPIAESERAYIVRNGWDAFEKVLADQDPDLFDLLREPLC